MGRLRFLFENMVTDEDMITVSSLTAGMVSLPIKGSSTSSGPYGQASMDTAGNYDGQIDRQYVVEIDGVSFGYEIGQATFKWSDNGGLTWNQQGVTTVSSFYTLSHNVQIKWTAGNGYDFEIGDRWNFIAFNNFNAGRTLELDRDTRYRSASVALGGELVTNGDFASDITGWNNHGSLVYETFEWSSGRLHAANTTGYGLLGTDDNIAVTAGKLYKVTFTIDKVSGQDVAIVLAQALNSAELTAKAWFDSGTHTFYFNPAVTENTVFECYNNAASEFYLDNVSIKEVPNYIDIDLGAESDAIVDEDCTDISDWGDSDVNGASVQTTEDYHEVFELAVASAANGNYARRYRTITGGWDGDHTTIIIKLKHSLINAFANLNYFSLQAAPHATFSFYAYFASDGLYINNGSGGQLVSGSTVRNGSWQEWKFVIDHSVKGSETCDIYLKDSYGNDTEYSLVASGVACDHNAADAAGILRLTQYGYSVSGVATYVDFLQIYNDENPLSHEVQALVFYDHNLTSNAVVNIKASDDNKFTKPEVSETLTYNASKILHYLAGTYNYRYWRIEIDDHNNPDGYIELGELYLGTYLELSKNVSVRHDRSLESLLSASQTSFGVNKRRFYNLRRSWNFQYHLLGDDDLFDLINMFETITDRSAGMIRPVYFNLDPDSSDTFYLVEVDKLPQTTSFNNLTDVEVDLREVLRSV
ncbi:MAG: hypothetical protein JRG97_15310 [Deltaproteobacteria bacterium]|nr:hypothetical protein [Deltaproteobacteria bacterium]MBW2052932.1 hypothetical protein [Deltaproteobacteria bacterium]MBW2142401.1 hypothetical protein [Deltaproteobacteria bacterium]